MIDAGLPIIQCLDILQSQQENITFKKMLKDIKESVESGQTLAEALKKYPEQFDNLFVNMVAAGEAGGILDVILRRLSAYMEKAARLKAQVKGAMTYPIVTLCIAVGVVAVILIFVIPVFEGNVCGLWLCFAGSDANCCEYESICTIENSLYHRCACVIYFCLQAVLQNRKGPSTG